MSEPLQDYWPILDAVWDQINIDDPESFAATTVDVSRPVILLYAAHFANSEICNGGFLQFFRNSTGVLAPEAIEGFQAIGMPHIASLTQSAAMALGQPYPRDRSDRWQAMLSRSMLNAEQLAELFKRNKDEYGAYREATANFGWRELEDQYYALIGGENGGFDSAATGYANRIRTE